MNDTNENEHGTIGESSRTKALSGLFGLLWSMDEWEPPEGIRLEIHCDLRNTPNQVTTFFVGCCGTSKSIILLGTPPAEVLAILTHDARHCLRELERIHAEREKASGNDFLDFVRKLRPRDQRGGWH